MRRSDFHHMNIRISEQITVGIQRHGETIAKTTAAPSSFRNRDRRIAPPTSSDEGTGRMAYFIDLFSPETYEAFSKSDREISGFRIRQQGVASRIKSGDTLVCYVTRVSRWCGLLDILEGPFVDKPPVFAPDDDPFIVRFRVKARAWLPIEESLPIHEDLVWNNLSFTRGLKKGSTAWTGKVRGSLAPLDDADGQHLDRILSLQKKSPAPYALEEGDLKHLKTHTVNRVDKVISVSVPVDAEPASTAKSTPEPESRESIRIQSLIAQIGAKMGLSIWVPQADRGGVRREWRDEEPRLLDRLPLNYDDTTLRTIEQIDGSLSSSL